MITDVLLPWKLQATMPSSLKHPSHVPMWRGTKVAYGLIAFCYFPVAIAGYWAYGDKVSLLMNRWALSILIF